MTITEKTPREAAADEQPPELLFPEANQRRRRRRLAVSLALLVVVGGVASALTALSIRWSAVPPPVLPTLPSSTGTPTEAVARVAWSDYHGYLHIGTLGGLGERVVVQTDADPTASLLAVGNDIFWVRSMSPTPDGTVNPIVDSTVQRYDLATGTVTSLGPGNQVFASVDRSIVYVATGSGQLAQFSASGQPTGHDLHIPGGWFLSDSSLLGDPTPVTANGILVQSAPVQIGRSPLTLAIWDPATSHVHVIGRVWKVIGTHTKPEAHSSLIAWLPARCEAVRNCPMEITNSSTLSTRSVYSPYGQGFEWGGGFSPDGSVLAAFVRGPTGLSPTARLVFVTGSGQVHQVLGTTIDNGDSLAWAAWFPDSRHLIVGGVGSPNGVQYDNHYLVSTTTRSSKPFRFLSDGQDDINFSTTMIP